MCGDTRHAHDAGGEKRGDYECVPPLLPAVFTTVETTNTHNTQHTTHNTQHDTTGRGGFDTDPSDSFRARVWLFVSYLVSFSALVGSVWMLVADYADKPYPWPGIAGVLQCAFILAAGLFMWATRGGGMNGDSGMYW